MLFWGNAAAVLTKEDCSGWAKKTNFDLNWNKTEKTRFPKKYHIFLSTQLPIWWLLPMTFFSLWKVLWKKWARGLGFRIGHFKGHDGIPNATQQAFMLHEYLKNAELHAHFKKCCMPVLDTLIFPSCGFRMELLYIMLELRFKNVLVLRQKLQFWHL